MSVVTVTLNMNCVLAGSWVWTLYCLQFKSHENSFSIQDLKFWMSNLKTRSIVYNLIHDFLQDHLNSSFRIIRCLGLFVWDSEVSPSAHTIIYIIGKHMKERGAKKSMWLGIERPFVDQIIHKTRPIALLMERQNLKNYAKIGKPSIWPSLSFNTRCWFSGFIWKSSIGSAPAILLSGKEVDKFYRCVKRTPKISSYWPFLGLGYKIKCDYVFLCVSSSSQNW